MEAVINYTEDGATEVVRDGEKENALVYEVEDMEAAVSGEINVMHLDYTKDVMEMMTAVRNEWGMKYPQTLL